MVISDSLHLFIYLFFFLITCQCQMRPPKYNEPSSSLRPPGMSQQHQDPVSGFPCGATTPQSPLLSPRMGQGQSPMLQQNQNQGPTQGGPPSYQPSPDHNGWSQPANISTSSRYKQGPPCRSCSPPIPIPDPNLARAVTGWQNMTLQLKKGPKVTPSAELSECGE